MKKKLLLLILVFCALQAYTQEEWEEDYREEYEEKKLDQYPIFAGIHPSFSIPLLDFQENMSRVGLGGGVEFLVNLNNSPFAAGIASTISNFGHESLSFVDNEGFELAWKTNSSLWDMHFLLQIEPPLGRKFQPYVQGKIGFNHFFTITRLVDETSGGDDGTLERLVDDNSWGLSFGGAVGGLFPLDNDWRYMLNARVSYLKGRGVSYYAKRETFTIVGDTLDAFDLMESAVDLVRLEVGVLVYLR